MPTSVQHDGDLHCLPYKASNGDIPILDNCYYKRILQEEGALPTSLEDPMSMHVTYLPMDISPELKSQCTKAIELFNGGNRAEGVKRIKSIRDNNKSSSYPHYCGATIMRLDTKTASNTFEFSLKAVEIWEKQPKPKELEDEDEG